jgi:retinol-binding protein 3
MFRKIASQIFVCLLFITLCHAENAKTLSSKERQQIVAEIKKLLDQYYVYPEKAKSMGDALEKKLETGAYDKISDPHEFAMTLTDDMHSVNNDRHLGFMYAPDMVSEMKHAGSKNEREVSEAEEKRLAAMRADNFGFRRVERLPGNVGYLDFRFFAPADVAGDTAVAALNFLVNCDAIIIDLRQNGGGDPTQIQLISSYFFKEPTHLNDIYTRAEDKTENFWTLPYVPGRKATGADLYVLTSKRTFSGAEEFSYNMKNLKRAVLIGETTGGGAHPTDSEIVLDQFVLDVPTARAINPITKTNWEGTGVIPDIALPADQAMDKAYQMALEKLEAKTTDPQKKTEIQWTLEEQKAKANPFPISEELMKKYAGTYGDRKITLENGQLYYQRTGTKYRLIPMNETTFFAEDLEGFRLEFLVKDGTVPEVVGVYIDGQREPSKRTN